MSRPFFYIHASTLVVFYIFSVVFSIGFCDICLYNMIGRFSKVF